jgi:hypothetical protein
LHCFQSLLPDCFKVFASGHNEEAFAVASFLPEFAELPFFDIVQQIPVTAVFIFHGHNRAIFQLTKEIRIKAVARCLQ